MKVKTGIFNLTFMVTSIVFGWGDSLFAKEKLIFIADEWCPYNCTPKTPKPGYLLEMLEKIFSEYEIEYRVMPWSRAEAYIKSHRNENVGLLATTKEDTPDMIFPEIPQGQLIYTFFARKQDNATWKYLGPESLLQVQLGAIKEYHYGVDEKDSKFNLNDYLYGKGTRKSAIMHGESPLESLVKMLEKGRIDTLIDDKNVITHTIAKMREQGKIDAKVNFEQVGVFNRKDVYIAFSPLSPKAAQLTRRVTEGTQKLRKDGVLKQILDRYNLHDWVP